MYGLVPASAVALSPSLMMVAMLKSVRCACPARREDVALSGGREVPAGAWAPRSRASPRSSSRMLSGLTSLRRAESRGVGPEPLPAPAPGPQQGWGFPRGPHSGPCGGPPPSEARQTSGRGLGKGTEPPGPPENKSRAPRCGLPGWPLSESPVLPRVTDSGPSCPPTGVRPHLARLLGTR